MFLARRHTAMLALTLLLGRFASGCSSDSGAGSSATPGGSGDTPHAGATSSSTGGSTGTGGMGSAQAGSSAGGAGSSAGGAGSSAGGASGAGSSAGGASGAGSSAGGASGAGSNAGGASGAGSSAGGASGAGSSAGGASGAGSNAGGASGAGSNAGGASGAGSNAGGASGSGASGAPNGGATGTVTWTASDYVSRKWARWPIPNPPSLSLPHPMSYTDGTTITDNVTGLVWQKITNAATTTWQDAINYCAGLGAGWSLPTRIELTSIIDNTLAGAKSDPIFKYGNKAGWTWASTPWVVDSRKTVTPPLSWFINTSAGDSNNSLSQLAASAYARCVKVPATQTLAAQHYTIQSGEVTDNYTGLIWQQSQSGTTVLVPQADALAYCNAMIINGHNSWRLPSLNELASIVDDVPTGNVSPAVDHTAFPTTSPNQWYWSASGYGTSTTDKWQLNFEDGFTSHKATTTLGIARCVR